MFLPNAERAIIRFEKIHDYILNEEHPKGKHKAAKLREATDLTNRDVNWVITQIAKKIQAAEAEWHSTDAYGSRYTVTIDLEGWNGTLTVQTAWIIREGEDAPDFTTLVPREPRRGDKPP